MYISGQIMSRNSRKQKGWAGTLYTKTHEPNGKADGGNRKACFYLDNGLGNRRNIETTLKGAITPNT